jgi:aminoglycoside 2'-N-acetyltransferase I
MASRTPEPPYDGAVRLEVVAGEALNGEVRREIIGLCESAYAEDFSRLFDLFAGSVHVLARDAAGVLVSHAEFVPRWLQTAGQQVMRTAYVEAVATAPSAQRKGLATAVLRHLVDVVAADVAWQLAALSPSDAAFYERRGWELWRGPLAIRCADHVEPSPEDEQVMIHRLPRTPPLDTTGFLTAEWREGELW